MSEELDVVVIGGASRSSNSWRSIKMWVVPSRHRFLSF